MGLLDDAIRQHLDLKRRRGADPAEIQRAEQEALGPVRRDPFDYAPDEFESASIADDRLRTYGNEDELHDADEYEEYGVEEEWEEEFEDEPSEPRVPDFETPRSEAGYPDSTRLMDHEALEDLEPPPADSPSYPAQHGQGTGAGDETMQYDVEEALAYESEKAEPEADWGESSEEWVEPERGPESPSEQGEPPHHFESDQAEPGSESYAPDEDFRGGDQRDTGARGAKPEDDMLEETPDLLQDAPDHDRLWFEQRPTRDSDFDE
jgi:hypothetical protein